MEQKLFRIRIRKGFIRHESLHRQGICFGRKVHTINITTTVSSRHLITYSEDLQVDLTRMKH